MIQTLKLEHSEDSKVFFTSDTHYYHKKLIDQRGFATIEEHNEAEINNWNSVVRPCDKVVHLGDFVLGAEDKSEQVCREIFARLNGSIFFFWGNHRAGVKQIYQKHVEATYGPAFKTLEVYPTTWNNVTFVGATALIHVKEKGGRFNKNHFFYSAHFGHRIWLDNGKGMMHLCGHSHGSDPESNPDYPVGKRLDVGVDNFNFTPVSLEKVLEIMGKKQVAILDHHDKDTNPS